MARARNQKEKKLQREKRRKMVRMIKAAVADIALTFLWVFCASTLGLATNTVTSALGLQNLSNNGLHYPSILVTTSLLCPLVFVFDVIAAALGGASYNPTANASFYAAGLGSDTLFSMALRFPAQAVGAVWGAVAITEVVPAKYRDVVVGPSLKVELHTGAVAEGALTFAITFIVLFLALRGPRNELLKTGLIAVSSVALVTAGSAYTGPSMNPANAFGWAYLDSRHNTWDQFYVYWICPFIGAILAARLFRVVFPPPVLKQKKT